MLSSILVFILVVIAILLVGIILVQSGQGDMGSAMGGNTMNQAFGSEGADKLLVKITTALATIFMVLAISIQLVGKSEVNDNKYMTDGEFTGNFEESKSEDVPVINLTTDSTDIE